MQTGKVVSVNLSKERGTTKTPVPRIEIDTRGVAGDAHADDWHRQVSLLAAESIARFSEGANRAFNYGDFAENITTQGLDLMKALPLDRFRIGSDAELEITQLGKKCHGGGCAIYQEVGQCVMPKEGIFCRVIQPGHVEPGMNITHIPRCLKCQIITLSDRASQGIYIDRSGPRIRERLEAYLSEHRWQCEISSSLIPDDEKHLEEELAAARETGANLIITTGSTGIGLRDIAPETVVRLADKIIPGIMEFIRMKHAENNPNALLSRAVAATMGQTLVYALPGSVKAVDEYLNEILKTLEHALFMLQNLDVHH